MVKGYYRRFDDADEKLIEFDNDREKVEFDTAIIFVKSCLKTLKPGHGSTFQTTTTLQNQVIGSFTHDLLFCTGAMVINSRGGKEVSISCWGD